MIESRSIFPSTFTFGAFFLSLFSVNTLGAVAAGAFSSAGFPGLLSAFATGSAFTSFLGAGFTGAGFGSAATGFGAGFSVFGCFGAGLSSTFFSGCATFLFSVFGLTAEAFSGFCCGFSDVTSDLTFFLPMLSRSSFPKGLNCCTGLPATTRSASFSFASPCVFFSFGCFWNNFSA